MGRTVGYLMLAAAAVLLAGAAGARYPNELPAFRLHETAAWGRLEPLVSTAEDVRRILGQPSSPEPKANSKSSAPAGASPVLEYDAGPDWRIRVYFVGSDPTARTWFADSLQDRLLSVDLLPVKPVPFEGAQFPPAFKTRRVIDGGSVWDEYADGTGLVYKVANPRTPEGDPQPRTLLRISYGPSDEATRKHARAVR